MIDTSMGINRKDEDILNDLHSAQGRLNFSEIKDLETELKNNAIQKKMHALNMRQETEEVNQEKHIQIEELKESLISMESLISKESIDSQELKKICKEPIA